MRLKKFPTTVTKRAADGEERSSLAGTGWAPAAPVLSGTFVTPETSLGLAAVFAAVNVISRDLASLPCHIYRYFPDGGREIDKKKPLEEALNVTPDQERDSFSFWQTSMAHPLGWGNSYSKIVRHPRSGEVIGLNLRHPSKTKPKRNDQGKLFYEFDNGERLAPWDVLHIAGLGFDGIQGYSPITVCRQTVGLGLGVEQFGAAFFGNGAVPKGMIKMGNKRLSEAAQDNLRNQINYRYQGSQNAHGLLFLEEGMDWVNTQVNPDDGQWIETRGFQVKEIARIYSMPPHKLGDYSESHLANVEEANEDYVTKTLMGWLCKAESQLNFKLLTPADRLTHTIGFDLEALLRANTAARMAKWQTLRNAGAVNADEIRLAEGMNPIGSEKGGDLYLVQGQYIPLNQVGKQPASTTPPKMRIVKP